jgi:hypothetical protein
VFIGHESWPLIQMGRISTISQKSSSQVTMTGRVSLFGSTLQTYRSRGKIETRLAGSSFIKRSMRASFFGHWDYIEEEKWCQKPLSKQVVFTCFG